MLLLLLTYDSYLLLFGFRVQLMHTEVMSIPEMFEGSIPFWDMFPKRACSTILTRPPFVITVISPHVAAASSVVTLA